jgi:hypothetical protein
MKSGLQLSNNHAFTQQYTYIYVINLQEIIFTVEAEIDKINTISSSKDNCQKQLEKKIDHY